MTDNSKKTNNKKSSAKKAPAKKATAKKAPAAKAKKPEPAKPAFVEAEEFVNAMLDKVSEGVNEVETAVKKQKRSIKRFFKNLFR
jgi:maltose-binding protein MalE